MLYRIDPTSTNLISRSNENEDGSIIQSDVSFRYELSELYIITKRGNRIALSEVWQSMEFSEDIFNNFVFGELTIVDPAGGDEKFVFSGGEEVHLKLRKTFTSDNISDTIVSRDDFVVTKIKSYSDEEGSDFVRYTFEIATKAFVKALKKRVYRSFGPGTGFASIVHSLYSENLDVAGIANIAVEDNRNGITKPLVIPGYSAHKAIQFAIKRASTDDDAIIFYERFIPSYFDGRKYTHFVVGMDTLKEQTPTKTIVYSPSLSDFRDLDTGKVLRASKFTRMDGFRHYENMMSGLYNSKITTHDIVNQTITENSYNLFSSDVAKLNGFIAADSLNLFTNFSSDEDPAERFIPASQNDAASRHKFVENYIVKLLSVRLQTIQVVISGGNNLLGIGDVVNFRCRSKLRSGDTGQRYIEDKVFSGKYLITAAKHYISRRDGYQKRLELSRESLNINLDEVFSFTSDLN